MFYHLASNVCFRGYEGTPYVLINKNNNHHELVTQKEYSLLLLCDGYFNFDSYELSEAEKTILQKYLDMKVITELSESLAVPEVYEYQYFNNRYIPSVQWSITPRCNFRCKHCYMDSPVTECRELTTKECFDIIDQIADCGIINVDLTGGEAMVRSDFWEIIDYLIAKKLRVGLIYTNGALLTDNTLDKFEERGIHPGFSVSFDCIGWHDWMRGVKGAEQMAIKALRLAHDRGYYTNVEMCMFKGNQDKVIDSLELLSDCGVTQVKICPVMDSDLWRLNAEGNELSTKEYYDYVINHMDEFFSRCEGVEVLLGAVINILADKSGYFLVSDKNGDCDLCKKSYLCNAMRNCLYISPEGRICPCISMASYEDQSIFELISEHPIKEQLTSGKYIKYVTSKVSELLEKNEECESCEYKYNCYGGCRSHALLQGNHDLWGIDIETCMIFKEGYMDKFREAAKRAFEKYGKPKEISDVSIDNLDSTIC